MRADPSAAPKRRRGPAPRISRQAVLDAARDLPPGSVTMTTIGDRLGVSGPALYRYFPDRTAILDALAHEARERLVPPDASLPWDQWLVEAARLERSLWRTHPDLYEAANYHAITHTALRMARTGLEVMTAAGFTIADAMSALAILAEMAHAIGRVEGNPQPPPTGEESRELAGLLASSEEPISVDLLFERSIAITIEGLRQRLSATRSTRHA